MPFNISDSSKCSLESSMVKRIECFLRILSQKTVTMFSWFYRNYNHQRLVNCHGKGGRNKYFEYAHRILHFSRGLSTDPCGICLTWVICVVCYLQQLNRGQLFTYFIFVRNYYLYCSVMLWFMFTWVWKLKHVTWKIVMSYCGNQLILLLKS